MTNHQELVRLSLTNFKGKTALMVFRLRGLQPADAEDVLQETYFAMLGRDGRGQTDLTLAARKARFHQIARNKRADLLRRLYRQPEQLPGDLVGSPKEPLVKDWDDDDYQSLLEEVHEAANALGDGPNAQALRLIVVEARQPRRWPLT